MPSLCPLNHPPQQHKALDPQSLSTRCTIPLSPPTTTRITASLSAIRETISWTMHSDQRTPRFSKRGRNSERSSPAPHSSRLSRFLQTRIPILLSSAALSSLLSTLESRAKPVSPLPFLSMRGTRTAQHPFRASTFIGGNEARLRLARDFSTATMQVFPKEPATNFFCNSSPAPILILNPASRTRTNSRSCGSSKKLSCL